MSVVNFVMVETILFFKDSEKLVTHMMFNCEEVETTFEVREGPEEPE